MITEVILSILAGIAAGIVDLIPAWTPPSGFSDSAISDAFSALGQKAAPFAAWVPLGLIAGLLVAFAAWVVLITGVRILLKIYAMLRGGAS